jgi:hypothetical protein
VSSFSIVSRVKTRTPACALYGYFDLVAKPIVTVPANTILEKALWVGVFTYVKIWVKGGALTGVVPIVQLDRQQFHHSGRGGGA